MSLIIVFTELNKGIETLLQGWFPGLVWWPHVIQHRIWHGILQGCCIVVLPGEVWMAPPPTVISIRIWIIMLPRLISFHVIQIF